MFKINFAPTIVTICLLSFTPLAAQVVIDLETEGLLESIVESFVESTDAESFDFNTLYDRLERYLNSPLDLNRAGEGDLTDMLIFSDLQIVNLIAYRQAYGDLVDVRELQVVPGFEPDFIRAIQPFVRVAGDGQRFHRPLGQMVTTGRTELFGSVGRTLEEKRGYTPGEEGQSRYLGNPWRYYMRFRHQHDNRLSYGLTAEKDPGEPFFDDVNKYGFDFYSAHFHLRDQSRFLRDLIVGDFHVSLGQGLIMHSGFGRGKSAFVTNISRGGRTLRPHTSVAEFGFNRGLAANMNIGDYNITAFASSLKVDGSVQIIEDDPAAGEDDLTRFFTSLQQSGLHRTPTEIRNKNAIRHSSAGLAVKRRFDRLTLGIHAVYNNFDIPQSRNIRPYNQFYFDGTDLFNAAVDYRFIYRNFNFFGETAISDNGGIATVNGMLIGLHRTVSLALLYRNLGIKYQAIYPNVFGESSVGNNESGFYAGLEIRPTRGITISSYIDLWQHPWLRFRTDASSRGNEFFVRFNYSIRRKLNVYAQYRVKTREQNITEDVAIRIMEEEVRENIRLHLSLNVTRELELRTRFDYTIYNFHDVSETGFMVFQDVLYRPMGSPISFTGRLSFFDTESFNSRIYAFENDLLYSFSVPPFSDRGYRYYLNLRYRPTRAITLEARIAQTKYTNRDQIGSGLETIEGNTRTDVKFQIRYLF
ncbi:MAG: helix-hairpin-helix domain-containing protein [Saprospirales bacterium]|nr:MAG: helix-hairpin-helix domain-containing protein [Saprospirales bacterium]